MNRRQFFRSAAPLAVAASLGACAQINSARDWVADPKTQQAAATVAAWGRAFTCKVSAAAALAGKIESAVNAGGAVQTTTGDIYTVSREVCVAIGGRPGQTVAPAAVQ